MSLYKKFCRETYDRAGALTGFSLSDRENYNFGCDVADALSKTISGKPKKRGLREWENLR